jgi:uncharacterized membrane protein
MIDPIESRRRRAALAHRMGVAALVTLVLLCVAWEWWLAPIRPGGSWLVLKAVPLAVLLWKIVDAHGNRRYAYQWSTLFIWFYFTEGVVRAWSDLTFASQSLAFIEVMLCTLYVGAAITYVRNTNPQNAA